MTGNSTSFADGGAVAFRYVPLGSSGGTSPAGNITFSVGGGSGGGGGAGGLGPIQVTAWTDSSDVPLIPSGVMVVKYWHDVVDGWAADDWRKFYFRDDDWREDVFNLATEVFHHQEQREEHRRAALKIMTHFREKREAAALLGQVGEGKGGLKRLRPAFSMDGRGKVNSVDPLYPQWVKLVVEMGKEPKADWVQAAEYIQQEDSVMTHIRAAKELIKFAGSFRKQTEQPLPQRRSMEDRRQQAIDYCRQLDSNRKASTLQDAAKELTNMTDSIWGNPNLLPRLHAMGFPYISDKQHLDTLIQWTNKHYNQMAQMDFVDAILHADNQDNGEEVCHHQRSLLRTVAQHWCSMFGNTDATDRLHDFFNGLNTRLEALYKARGMEGERTMNQPPSGPYSEPTANPIAPPQQSMLSELQDEFKGASRMVVADKTAELTRTILVLAMKYVPGCEGGVPYLRKFFDSPMGQFVFDMAYGTGLRSIESLPPEMQQLGRDIRMNAMRAGGMELVNGLIGLVDIAKTLATKQIEAGVMVKGALGPGGTTSSLEDLLEPQVKALVEKALVGTNGKQA